LSTLESGRYEVVVDDVGVHMSLGLEGRIKSVHIRTIRPQIASATTPFTSGSSSLIVKTTGMINQQQALKLEWIQIGCEMEANHPYCFISSSSFLNPFCLRQKGKKSMDGSGWTCMPCKNPRNKIL
jgi:hypothetical protein